MGGLDIEAPYNPTSRIHTKPNNMHMILSLSSWKKLRKVYSCVLFTFVCVFFYLLGAWHHDGLHHIRSPTTTGVIRPHPTNSLEKPSGGHGPSSLDFTTHHSKGDVTTMVEVNESYPVCDLSYSEHTPCEDFKRSLKFNRNRLIYRERHCPPQKERLKCLIPAPYEYKNPFPWPESREYAWYNNVPHRELTVEKAVQNWILFEGDRFKFPGGGTMFPNGADAYINDIGKLINLKNGTIRTAIDTGCGVASWGAYLLSRDILTMSFAPRDTHQAQVQFALERGVPALIGVMASQRLPYPSRSFDMAHCSRCLIPWDQYDGVYLMEVDRVLRPGGYRILSGPPIRWRKHWKGWQRRQEDLDAEQTRIENVAESMCWKKVGEKNDIAIWQKPLNHMDCKRIRKLNSSPPLCPASQDPDRAWYTNMETCLTPLPEVADHTEVAGGELARWPERLNAIPPRIQSGSMEKVTPTIFQEDTGLWKRRVACYKSVNQQLDKKGRYRNLLDMNANLGGFAAALIDDPVWVMNVVPVEAEVNTLGVIYERGLIGTYQSWCEAMSTYPRTYDLIHADSIYRLYNDKCGIEDILLEMDRILRPEGTVIIREDVDNLIKMKRITDALKWKSQIIDHEDGPFVKEKLLFAVKLYWTAPKPAEAG